MCVLKRSSSQLPWQHSLPLDLLVVALSAKLLDVLFAEALLGLTPLLEDLYGLVKRLDGRPLHLDLLQEEETGRRRKTTSVSNGENHFLL